MILRDFNAVCAELPATTKVIQWGGRHVWKVGGKVFAIGVPETPDDACPCGFTIKTEPQVFDFLLEVAGVNRASYLTTGHWVHIEPDADMDDDSKAAYIAASHAIIAAKLTRAVRRKIGLG